MIQRILPGPLQGSIKAIPSKSMAHRLLICAALALEETRISCQGTSNDIEATAACLQAMGTLIAGQFHVIPGAKKLFCRLPCGESGSTLRFLLPVAAALGLEAEFHMEGRLPQRPISPLDRQLLSHGVTLTKPDPQVLRTSGQLRPGDYVLPGNVSSQYISGLLFALPLLRGTSTLTVLGPLESASYVEMTLDALAQFGVQIIREGNVFTIPGQSYVSPGRAEVEGDWSNAAFWLCAGALGQPITVTGLNPDSLQGDRAILDILSQFGAKIEQSGKNCTVSPGNLAGIDIDASAIPDLVPVLAVVAAAAEGTTRIYHAGRLRLKESDRLETVRRLLEALGGNVRETPDGLIIHGGKPLQGGTVDSCNDHRIAMAAAIASILCESPVTVTGAEAVEKSYPRFWEDFEAMLCS